jgi:hypothetical protein
VFIPHQRGPITSTFTTDWFLREGQGHELLGEWMTKTTVKSQDQRRMLQSNSHTFPTNSWIHKITKGRESDRCDLCRTLWMTEGRFKTEEDPRGISKTSDTRMEVLVCLRREMPPDYLERHHSRL